MTNLLSMMMGSSSRFIVLLCLLDLYCGAVHVTMLDMSFTHKGPRRFYEYDDAHGLDNASVERIQRILTALQDACSPRNMNLPGWRLHRLKGDHRGQWSIRVSSNWRLVFRFENSEAVDIDLTAYH